MAKSQVDGKVQAKSTKDDHEERTPETAEGRCTSRG
jgi:hypothetical protein